MQIKPFQMQNVTSAFGKKASEERKHKVKGTLCKIYQDMLSETEYNIWKHVVIDT